MQEPTRLRLDPDQPAALRHALDAELSQPLGHDLVAMKAALTGQLGASSATGLGVGAKLIAALVAAGGVAGLWLSQSPEPPTITPAAEVAQVAPAAVVPVASVAEPTTPAPVFAALAADEFVGPEAPAPAPAPAAAARPATEAQPEPEPSGLAAELAAYAAARDALEANRHAEAAAGFGRYRAEYPGGSLLAEAMLGELEALHEIQRYDDLRRLADRALLRPELAGRRADVYGLLAEAEIMAGRCSAAADAYRRAGRAGASVTEDQITTAVAACERRAMR